MTVRFGPKTWFWIFLLVGIGTRLARYLAAPPIFGDEAAIGLNIVNKSFAGLLGGLDYQQVAPVGFLWIERAMFEIMGMHERSMLLWPTLASVAALIVFACWTRILLEPMASAIATGILAMSEFTVRHSVELKPYSGDLLFSLLLLLPATLYLVQRRDRWLACVVAVTPLALFMSYPSTLTAGGIWLVLAAVVFRRKKRSAALVLAFGIVLAVSFLCLVLPAGTRQYAQTQNFMLDYWKDAFPPAAPLHFVAWILRAHTGGMFSYPFEGGSPPWSAGNFALFALGILYWLRLGRGNFVTLLLLPFGLTFLAAVLHHYPYGGNARITQHLVPAIIVFATLGLVDLFRRLGVLEPEKRSRLAFGITFAILLMLGVGQSIYSHVVLARDLRPEALVRRFVRTVAIDVGESPTFIKLNDLPYVFPWYVRELNQSIVATTLDRLDPARLSGPLWVIVTSSAPEQKNALERMIGRPSTADWVFSTGSGKSENRTVAYGFRPLSSIPAK